MSAATNPMTLISWPQGRPLGPDAQQTSSVTYILSLRQVAAVLGVHVNTVRRYLREEGLPWVQLSKRRIGVDARDLERWIAQRKRTAGS